jgi:hypothetical protein
VLVREDVGTAANTQLFEQIFQFVNFSLAIPTVLLFVEAQKLQN